MASRRKSARKPAAASRAQAVLRLYCQGIGDCHLVKFTKADGGDFWMLIDCGVHTSVTGGPAKVDAIVDDILSVTTRLDVVVATHEHWDHISGFLTAKQKFARFDIGEIWMAWSENPKDPDAKALDKFKDQALTALSGASRRLDAIDQPDGNLASVRDGLGAILGFSFGLKGERVRSARDALVSLAPKKVRYLDPKSAPLQVPSLPNLRIYVLGPPRDRQLLGIMERDGEMYGLSGEAGYGLASAIGGAVQMLDGTAPGADDFAMPFDTSVGDDLDTTLAAMKSRSPSVADDGATSLLSRHYREEWRRIDHDWLGVSADLAMQLDNRTNNTSLVLAFEFVDSERVMLFAADAQVGNWLSWQDLEWRVGARKVTGPDLLSRTVFYKVGHHGSHNATLKSKGLEQMTNADLSAFIPTNAVDAKKVKWGAMPFKGIVDELEVRTSGRTIRADDSWVAKAQTKLAFTPPSGSVQALRHSPGLWVEFDIA